MQRVYEHTDSRQIANLLNNIIAAVSENTGSFSLANTATTTTVSDPKVTTQSKIFLQPRNANAASASAFISSIGNGSFVVGHASATTARPFDFAVFGV